MNQKAKALRGLLEGRTGKLTGRFFALLLTAALLSASLAGCGASGGAASGTDAPGAPESGTGTVDGTEDEGKGDEESGDSAFSEEEAEASDSGKDGEEAGEEETDGEDGAEAGGFIHFTAVNHPLNLVDGDRTLAEGNYYEIQPDSAARKAYPALIEAIEALNAEAMESRTENLQSVGGDAGEMMDNGWLYPFESTEDFVAVRADDRVFSYRQFNYSYMGGAHGFGGYTAVNLDPRTGEKIPLTAVVEITNELPEIFFEELLKSNDDLVDYFGEGEGLRQDYLKMVGDMLKDDGAGLTWALGYEGLHVYYGDYGMGSYAAGAREELIPFRDHPEIFLDTYVNYEGEYPDITEQVVMKENRETEELPYDPDFIVHEIPLVLRCRSNYQDGSGSGENENFGVYTWSEGYETGKTDGIYWQEWDGTGLKKRLSGYNQANFREMKQELEPYHENMADAFHQAFPKDDGVWRSYEKGIFLSLCRADTRVLSFVEYRKEDGILRDSLIATGRNFDSHTGEDLDLLNVITDKDRLKELLEKKLRAMDMNSQTEKRAFAALKVAMEEESLVSREDFSWNLYPNGLMVHLNTEVNYPLFSSPGGVIDFFISFAEEKNLFRPEYRRNAGNYVFDMEMMGDYPGTYFQDLDQDGSCEEIVCMAGEEDENGWYESLELRIDDEWFTLRDGIYFYDAAAFLVHKEDGRNYLYVQMTQENDYRMVSVYCLEKEPYYVETLDGAIQEKDWNESSEDSVWGFTMTTPSHFRMETVDWKMGTYFVSATYGVDEEGLPICYDSYLSYPQTGQWHIKAAEEIEADVVDEDGMVLETDVMKAGTLIRPYRISQEGELWLKSRDGRTWLLRLEEDENGNSTYRGKELMELFEGLLFAG